MCERENLFFYTWSCVHLLLYNINPLLFFLSKQIFSLDGFKNFFYIKIKFFALFELLSRENTIFFRRQKKCIHHRVNICKQTKNLSQQWRKVKEEKICFTVKCNATQTEMHFFLRTCERASGRQREGKWKTPKLVKTENSTSCILLTQK